jgi:glutamine synthetase adenylyltransferase
VRILELLAQNDIMDEQKRGLTHAYTTLRDALHHLALQEQPGNVAPDAFTHERAGERQLAEVADGLTKKSGVLLSRAKFESRRRES